MTYIYDASFIIAIILPDEINQTVDNIHNALDENDAVFIPHITWYETANIFRNLIIRKRFSADEVSRFIPMLSFVDLKTDSETGINYTRKIWQLGNDYNITAYDAAYLELAERKNAILCTLDVDLLKAAKKHGVRTINQA